MLVAVAALAFGALPVPAAPSAEAATCDPAEPATCTLRELADRLGFRMGATLEPHEIADAGYTSTLTREFNALTPENALKWYTVQPSPGVWDFGPGDAVVGFAHANGMAVRGHTLVWAQDTYTPAWVRAIGDADELRARVEEQIRTVMERYRGTVHRWDVVNEPLATGGTTPSDSVFQRVLGPDWVADAFRHAHAVDPDAELWLNEFGTDQLPAKHVALVDLVTELLDDGVPLHGVGIQTHRFSVDGPDPATFEQQLRDFTDLGLEVAVTELDVATSPTDPAAFERQADAYRTVVQACVAVPGCDEVTTWGLTDASSWLDGLGFLPTPTRPLLFDDQLRPKPAYDAVREVLAAAVLALPSPDSPPPTTWTDGDRHGTAERRSVGVAPAPAPVAPVALPTTATPRLTG